MTIGTHINIETNIRRTIRNLNEKKNTLNHPFRKVSSDKEKAMILLYLKLSEAIGT
ncbi:hypothetical protein KL86DYS1_20044 [uncultured Dysgonomonas sp.]|uniref:Uncharacterized protein n=1 Tax=uncultured Dysgonomonas sp. TaxID=206096 RepID=A0A212JKA3_9BACT|nr:hypothetical protein KL86DYS1_20044 [uncultured Dysgonomonas sp.]